MLQVTNLLNVYIAVKPATQEGLINEVSVIHYSNVWVSQDMTTIKRWSY